jgi:hypothetical protein
MCYFGLRKAAKIGVDFCPPYVILGRPFKKESKSTLGLTRLISLLAFLIWLASPAMAADTLVIPEDSAQTVSPAGESAALTVDSTDTMSEVSPAETAPESQSAFRTHRINALVLVTLFSIVILVYTRWARKGKELFIRKLNGLDEVEEAVGRATEMGKPVLFIPGINEIDNIQTIAGISILSRVARITARYETPLRVPVPYPMVLAAGQEVVEQAYIEEGKHDAYDKDTVRYVAGEQFAFAATVNGMMIRERPATNIYMGAFYAESLLLAETGNAAGSIQIAGTAEAAQLPFFIAACDYTLMGEELYAASAYLSREPLLLGGLKGQDWIKVMLVILILAGVILVSVGWGDWYLSLFESV